MNPYLVGFAVGTGVGLWYEKDLEKAATRAGIVTALSRGIQTPLGGRIISSVGLSGVIIAKDAISVGSTVMATSTAAAITTGATYVGAVAAGYVIGAAVGIAISSTAFGQSGKQKALDFYTFQNTNPIDYVPHYNAFKIVKHYVE